LARGTAFPAGAEDALRQRRLSRGWARDLGVRGGRLPRERIR
jgi:hypothetical protein